MAIKTSTGLRNIMLASNSFRGAMALGVIKIYAGPVPQSADDSVIGNPVLCTVTSNGTATGLTFETTPSAGVITKNAAEVWKGTNVLSGTARFYRLTTAADDGEISTTLPRVQGLIGTAGADLNLSNVELSAAATQTIDFYSMALPTN